MSKVHVPPQGANFPAFPHPPLDVGDSAAFEAWLASVREHILDLLSIAEDAVKPVRERMFSRHEAARRLTEEERALLALIDAGVRRLPPARS